MYKTTMLKIYQNTLDKAVKFEGIGLHSGKKVEMNVIPNDDTQGIYFKRVDLKSNNIIKADYKNVSSAKLCTTLENKFGIKVSTVEHLLAALYICEIDNAIIEINNEEVPIMDGSAKDFLNGISKAGIKKTKIKRKYLKVQEKLELIDQDKKISIEPSNSFEVFFQLDYQNKIIGNQKNIINFYLDPLEDVVSSRTFCLFEDIEIIKKNGLAKGGSLENALVVDKDKVLNEGGLRNSKEFVNHKILDLAGDFLLSGFRVLGKINCFQGGHKLTNTFLRRLLETKSAYSITELKDNVVISKKIRSHQPLRVAANA